jgi:hypothetical protein
MISNSVATKNYGAVTYRPTSDGDVSKTPPSMTKSKKQQVQMRKEMFEQLAMVSTEPKKIRVEKGWRAEPNAPNGGRYHRRVVYHSNVATKKTLAELP